MKKEKDSKEDQNLVARKKKGMITMHIFGRWKVFWRWLRPRPGPKPRNEILVLLDLENLLLNIEPPSPFEFSLTEGFEKMIKKLAEFGRVIEVFVFGPPPTINIHLDMLHKMGFRSVTCPRVVMGKDGPKMDTVDAAMIDFGKRMIAEMGGLTHLCIGSGDQDFLPLVKEAKRCGIGIVIFAGSEDSLSEELANTACKNPLTEERAVYFFSPKEDNP